MKGSRAIRNMRTTRAGRPSVRTGGIVLLLLVLVVCLVAFGIARQQSAQHVEKRGIMSEGFGQRPRIERNGQTYIRKTDQTIILLMGIDHTSEQASTMRNGGQSDFLLLLVLDHEDKTVRQLQIDRDTITDVAVLGVLGNEAGVRPLQICLAHGFGANEQVRCQRTVETVEHLMDGLQVDLYWSMNLNAIGRINALLGGVQITLQDDFTELDPSMAPGTTLVLNDQQAELFVRSRTQIGDGTNASRMSRQRVYLAAAAETFRQRMSADTSFAGVFYDGLSDVVTTDITRGRMINELNRAYRYTVLPVETLEGEHYLGNDGFMEFHVQENAALRWVLDALYVPFL